jgi:peptidyl-prolyl cis-trans isomerase C
MHIFRRTSMFPILLICLLILPGYIFAGGQKEKEVPRSTVPQAAPEETKPAETGETAAGKKRSSLAISAGAIASVNGEAITEEDFTEQINNLKLSYRAQRGTQMPPEEQKALEKQVLQAMITKTVLLQQYRELGLSVDPDRVKQEIQKVRDQYPSEAEFKTSLSERGYTMERLEKEITQSLQVFMVQQRAVDDVEVTDEEISRTYNNNLDKFTQPESVRARHILIKADENATEEEKAAALRKIQVIRDELAAGADFASLATQKSEGPSAENGGDLGYFTADRMVPSFSNAAFALDPGEISGIVETRFGYHIIKLEDRKEPWLPTLDQVREQLKPQLEQQKAQYVFQEYVQKIQGEADIKIYRPDLKPAQAN